MKKTNGIRTRIHSIAMIAGLSVSLLASGGCQLLGLSDSDDQPGNEMLLVSLATLSQFRVNFSVSSGSSSVSCSSGGSANTYTMAGGTGTSLKDLRLYIHNVRLVSGGVEAGVSLTNDGVNQHSGVAFLDFEDATGDCSGSNNTTSTNTSIYGTVNPGAYTSLRFTVGVPESLNHTDVSASDTPAPLNISAMNWSWAVGRKFVRAEVKNGTNTGTFHLGAQTCSGTAPDITCTRVDRPEVEVAITSGGTAQLDLQQLFSHTSWDITGASKTCHSNPASPAQCPDVFPKLGLDWSDGSSDRSGQTVFSAQ